VPDPNVNSVQKALNEIPVAERTEFLSEVLPKIDFRDSTGLSVPPPSLETLHRYFIEPEEEEEQPFRLKDLPPELRNQVYEHYVATLDQTGGIALSRSDMSEATHLYQVGLRWDQMPDREFPGTLFPSAHFHQSTDLCKPYPNHSELRKALARLRPGEAGEFRRITIEIRQPWKIITLGLVQVVSAFCLPGGLLCAQETATPRASTKFMKLKQAIDRGEPLPLTRDDEQECGRVLGKDELLVTWHVVEDDVDGFEEDYDASKVQDLCQAMRCLGKRLTVLGVGDEAQVREEVEKWMARKGDTSKAYNAARLYTTN